jgi:uncharacterized repeat protein (TIGR01451 family)
MKYSIINKISSGLLTIILAVGNSYSLDYIEASTGLENPQWEGGRTEIEMADMNLDGYPDLISIGDHGSPFINTQEHGVMVYFGNAQCLWTLNMNGNFGYGGICAGDVNSDGYPDIGYGMHHNYSTTDFGDQLIEVALGDGTGRNWTPWDDNLATQGETYGMFASDFGDVDNDGDLDIGVTSFGSGNPLMVYKNNGNGTWTHSQAVTPGPNNGMHIVFGDINKDGNLDLATAYQSGTVFFGYGNGIFFNANYNLPAGGIFGLNGCSLGDVDGDGGMDLSYAPSAGVKVWTFNESTNLWEDFSGNLPTTGTYQMTQLYDMDADGHCDIAAAGNGQVSVWTGTGNGVWTLAARYVIQNDPDCPFEAFRVGGDIDHNGFPDIVHLTDEGSWINSFNHLRFYKESSTPTTLTCIPIFPRGGEVFKGGAVRFTNWVSAIPGGGNSTVTVELSISGLTGPWTFLGQNLPNSGHLQWIVPTGATSSNCYIRYTVTAGVQIITATTPASFTILGAPPNVNLTLAPVNPPIIIPAVGGNFQYTVDITNGGTTTIACNAWITATLPNGTAFGPIINAPLVLAVGNLNRLRSQAVPAGAPAGVYSYNAYIGIYPSAIWDSSSFNFSKQGMGGFEFSAKDWSTDFAESSNTIAFFNASPNPFNSSVVISFELPDASPVDLRIYNNAGREVWRLETRDLRLGTNQVEWNAEGMPSGVYFVRMSVDGGQSIVQKVVLMK